MESDKRKWKRPKDSDQKNFNSLPNTQKIKTAKGRKLSSTRWLQRHFSDPYVKAAYQQGYRSRAAFKLKELNERFQIISKNDLVIDLGAAPGGWSQIALKEGAKQVIGIDLLSIEPMQGAEFFQMDFTQEKNISQIQQMLSQKVDVVLSDMAAPLTGHQGADQRRTEALAEASAEFALKVLKKGGCFVTKLFQTGAHPNLFLYLKTQFETVKHAKPPSSRSESSESYILALCYKKSK